MRFGDQTRARSRTLRTAVMTLGLLWVSLWHVAHLSAQTGSGTIRVATSGNDIAGCGTVGTPCATIQHAVNIATSTDEIRVAAGTYAYDAGEDACIGPLGQTAVVCVLNKPVTILGGFTTGNWTVPNPTANVTVIDGLNTGRGVYVWSPGAASGSLRMEGFTIRNGLAQGATSGGDNATFAFGGGLLADFSPIMLKNVVFRSNRAVGGNTGTAYGGAASGGGLAIRNETSGTSTIEDVVFDANQAQAGTGPDRGGIAQGGGLFTFGSVLNGNSLTFVANVALAGNSGGGGVSALLTAAALGGAAAVQIGSTVVLSDVTATGNIAQAGDAGTTGGDSFGGALYVEASTCSLTGARLHSNLAAGGDATNGGLGAGGGVATFDAGVTIDRTFLTSNTSRGGNGSGGATGSAGGGGAYFQRTSGMTSINVSNSIIADNLTETGTTGSPVGGGGGGIFLWGADIDLVYCILAANRLGSNMQGQAIVVPTVTVASVVDVSYSIVANHLNVSGAAAVHVQSGNTVNFVTGLFADNSKDTNSDGTPGGTPGTFNGIGSMIAATSAGFAEPGDYHLGTGSSAVNAATGSVAVVDIDGLPRADPVPDIGADELGSGLRNFLALLGGGGTGGPAAPRYGS